MQITIDSGSGFRVLRVPVVLAASSCMQISQNCVAFCEDKVSLLEDWDVAERVEPQEIRGAEFPLVDKVLDEGVGDACEVAEAKDGSSGLGGEVSMYTEESHCFPQAPIRLQLKHEGG